MTSQISPEHDVLIVGAGPAGSATAISYLKRNPNLKIALADKSAFPRDKACGDGLGPGVVSALAGLNIDFTDIPGAFPVRYAEVHGIGGISFRTGLQEASLDASHGLTVRREEFDDFLRRRAIASGAAWLPEHRFLSYETKDNMLEVHLQNLQTGADLTTTCQLLVGADGASSRVRRQAGIAPSSSKRTGIGIRAYADIPAEWSDRIVISYEEQLRPGYGWCFPLSDGTANVGCGMVVKDYQRLRPDLKELLGQYLDVLADRGLQCSEPSNHSTHILPSGVLPKLTADRIALVGDAASMINPLSGEGIVYGMTAGTLLADATAKVLSQKEFQQTSALSFALRQYEKQFRTRYAAHFRSTYLAQKMLRSKTWAKVFLRGASRDPKIRGASIDLMFGDGKIDFSSPLRAIWHGLKKV